MSNFQIHKLAVYQSEPKGTEEHFFSSHDAAAACGKEMGEQEDVTEAYVSVHPVMHGWPSTPIEAVCEKCGENGIVRVYDNA